MTRYDPHNWTSHLFDWRGSLVREILGRVMSCVLWSLLVVAAHETWKDTLARIQIPESGHALIGGALALLLVFRTNASYDRFWEGRKLWGGIVNETRNLARQASVLLADQPHLVRSTLEATIAFPYAAMRRLRGTDPPADILSPGTARILGEHQTALAVARSITQQLQTARAVGLITDVQQMAVDANVQQLIDFLGGCERIHSTPLPYPYAVHLRRALILYCFTLPFALVKNFGWDAVPATLLISYILFGIEEIGVEIEDPFGIDENDLPLEEICANIERSLSELLPPAVAPSSTMPLAS